MNRRHFLTTAAVGATGLFAAHSNSTGLFLASSANADETGSVKPSFPDYENRLQDRLWMWGHDSGCYDGPNGVYKIPLSEPITMADAIRYMGIPNVCVIRGGTPGADYRRQFDGVKRLTWNLSSGSNESYRSLREYDFKLLDEMPNLIGFDLDDFFRGGPDIVTQTANGSVSVHPAALSLEELSELQKRMKAYSRPLDLRAVLYSAQLKPSIGPAMDLVDTVALWTWSGADVLKLEENFRKYREIVPAKPTLLGIYMWDFGGKKPMEMSYMEHQLKVALKLYKDGEIEGLIFHCTPLCNKNLPAVEYSRQWIQDHAKESR